MREKKHIDRLFQEKFKDFEAHPDERVWKGIAASLSQKQKKAIPLWYKMAGAAAVLAILFLAGTFFFAPNSEINLVQEKEFVQPEATPLDVDSDKKTETYVEAGNTLEKQEKNPTVFDAKTPTFGSDNTKITTVSDSIKEAKKALVTTQPTRKTKLEKKNVSPVNETKLRSESPLEKSSLVRAVNKENPAENPRKKSTVLSKEESQITDVEKEVRPIPKDSHKKVIKSDPTEAVASAQEASKGGKSLLVIAEKQKREKVNQDKAQISVVAKAGEWQVSPFVAPVFYSNFGASNAVDPSLAHNKGSGGTSMSYGVNVAYQVSEKVKIRSGVSQVSMGYQVENIAFAPAVSSARFSNVSYSSGSSDMKILNQDVAYSSSNLIGAKSPFTEGTLNQQYGFIEVPLELEYALLSEEQFSLSIIGGASTLFLDKNHIAIESRKGVTNIGEASNINEVSFSTNVGIGLGYDLSKAFEVSLEPIFKYQINTFSKNTNGFKPYYFGVYTKISFTIF